MSSGDKLQPFEPDSEELASYLERVEIFFAAHDVPEGKQVPVLLNSIGVGTYGILRSLFAPESPKSKSYAAITEKLREHFKPCVNIIAERFYFHKRDQNPAESATEYVAEFRRLAARCAFETYLNQALRDRFVCGLRNESIQRSLLAIKDLTLAAAVEKAKELEAADKNAQALKKTAALSVGRLDGRSKFSPRKHSISAPSGRGHAWSVLSLRQGWTYRASLQVP